MNQPNGGELAANAARALERYREMEVSITAVIAEIDASRSAHCARLAMVKEFIAALTATPRAKRTVRVVDGPIVDPAELPPEGERYADKD